MKKQSAEEARKHFRSFRMNDEELAQFLENLRRADLSGSDFIRLQVCKTPSTKARRRPRADEKALAKTLGALLRIGANINQIAKVLNTANKSGGSSSLAHVLEPISGELATALADFAQTRAQISNALTYDTGSE